MSNILKKSNFLEIFFTMIILVAGFFILQNKISLTTDAKEDVILLKNLRSQIIKKDLDLQNPLIIKNNFGGDIKMTHNNNLVTIESNNLPYQSCLRYALDGEIFDSIYINNKLLYLNGQMVSRDNALKLCLLSQNHSVVQYNIKI